MSGSKGRDLLMADKVTKSDEKSVETLDSYPSYEEPAEKRAGQESVEELNRGILYFNDRFPDGYDDNGDLIWICLCPQREETQAGTR